MADNVARKLIRDHLIDGEMTPGTEIALRIDQSLTQDATGTMVMLELEAMQLDRVKTELSAQYVDHNLIQEDFKNPDDHLFLYSACQRFGVWFSRAGNGVSHAVHMERFGRPGKTLLGSDSHTPAAGSMGMLAIGAGGLEVAMAMAGEPFYTKMPEIWGVELTGELPPWVSAKDVILEMLRRHDVKGGVGRIIEYYGPGLANLTAMDRHVIANMGAELGATTTVFPADDEVRRFLRTQKREDDFTELTADPGCDYDVHDSIDLSSLEPLIAKPTSPGNVVPVREVAGESLYQAYIGSSANPGYRDFAMPAMMVAGRRVDPRVSFDINPSSRAILETLTREGHLADLIHGGARLHQAGCNGCIGMGQAPASGRNSLRTVPRNFPGRSGTKEDAVFLCSPETATASALRGEITDPRELDFDCPTVVEPDDPVINEDLLQPPPTAEESRRMELAKGPNIASLPDFEGLPDELDLPVLLKVGDNISTDEIMRAGAEVLPFRSNIPAISRFVYDVIDETYPERAQETGDHAIVGGENYGQGSSREHAAIAPRYLGLRAVVAKNYARIHWQNLVNFGVLPLTFAEPADYDRLEQGGRLRFEGLRDAVRDGSRVTARLGDDSIEFEHALSARQVELLLAGGLINWMRDRQ
ncbi:aconitate hydratase [Salinisphaera sp. PC39]|uniref:aconitate hydratase n=1 Tax=Salinisphaera sp. PC39 TaxID=1304156 RepID=UPI0033410F0A